MHIGIGRHIQGQLGILLHQEDGNALFLVELVDDPEISWMSLRCQAHGGFVEQDQLGARS
jgi:hypothetical protein